jgi:hypothetical protein
MLIFPLHNEMDSAVGDSNGFIFPTLREATVFAIQINYSRVQQECNNFMTRNGNRLQRTSEQIMKDTALEG